MIPSLANRHVWVYMDPIHMRKVCDGHYGIARGCHSSPRNGDVFLFDSSDRKKAKALFLIEKQIKDLSQEERLNICRENSKLITDSKVNKRIFAARFAKSS